METKIGVGDTVYFMLEDVKTIQPWRKGKVLEVKRTRVFTKSTSGLIVRIFGENMYRVTCDNFLFPKSGIWMHRSEIRVITQEMLDSLEELSKMEW